ncbi:MAG: cellulose 1,4-beta-cellobiosidase [Candidatus Nomurabacteria bacterium]|nr:cellulose 1,4-beta-cellobiosidase [Candidatus Nomurabacteria bacterium]
MQEYLPLLPVILLLATTLIFIRLPFFTTLLSAPYSFIVAILQAFGLVKPDRHWSVVYDAKTKLPIDPAYITVKNTLGVEVASMITDLNGRFALILPRGLYTIDVQKTNYKFPSERLNGAHADGTYTGLYFGETLEVVDSERAVAIAVPMDPEGADWNQAEKKRHNVFFHFGNENNYKGAELFYGLLGIILSGWWYEHTMNHFYFLLFWAYAVLMAAVLLWRLFETSHYTHSVIFDKNTKLPLSFARVTIFSAARHTQVTRKTTSLEGQFTALLSPGRYYLTIEKRDDHGVYTPVFTSPVFHSHDGYIGKKFVV